MLIAFNIPDKTIIKTFSFSFYPAGIHDSLIQPTDYAVLKIRVRMERWLLPHDFMKEWRKKIMGVLGF